MNKTYLQRFTAQALLGFWVTAILSACATDPITREPSFEVQLTGRSLQIVQGSSTDFQVRLNRNRFTDPITVTASELPAGVTAGAVTTTGSIATLRFLAAADAAQGETKSVTLFATAGSKTSEAVTTALSVRGAPGALDTTFSGGRVTIPDSIDLEAAALAPDGNIILVGTNRGDTDLSLLRLTADGQPDSAFPTRTFRLAPSRTFVGGVVVQPDGKIVVAVDLESVPGQSSLGAVRFTAQGELDPSFSQDGIATLGGIQSSSLGAVALAPDGSVVVAGSMFNGQNRDFLLVRFSAVGQPNLGAAGFITDSFGASNDSISAVAVALDSSIVVTGQTQFNNGTSRFILARYLNDGTKDGSFGEAGHFTAEFNDDISSSAGRAIILQPDGKIIAAGFVSTSAFSGLGLIRLLPDGKADASFGDDGVTILDFEPSNISADGTSLALEPNGHIVVTGTVFNFNNSDFALARLESNGKLDLSFGDEGRQTTDFGGTNDRLNTLLRSSSGRLVLVGSSGNELSLTRYWP